MGHSEDTKKNTKFKKGDEANSTSLNTHANTHTCGNAKPVKLDIVVKAVFFSFFFI